ncbi:MAG: pyridoxamine 5'-phosphate oxidase family protein [Nitrospinae bacterium]|nr:pyridoxamine 5'-phosphate oxidase family protein [Nitrospinota bacterium]
MAKEWGTIPDHLAKFAMEQPVFFIASALGGDDVNLSPKGVAPLRVLDARTVIYADYWGSGNQTAAHLAGGGKATLVFISFGEKPLILRFYCTGRVAAKDTDEFNALCAAHYKEFNCAEFRQLFVFEAYRVQTSCGYGVPVMKLAGDRRAQPYFRELLGEQ